MGEEIEVWKPIIGYINLYKIGSLGNVMSIKTSKIRKPHFNRDGYLYVSLCKYGETKTLKIHRIVAEHFCINSENKTHVDHIDGNKSNNNCNNLRWCTHAENIKYGWKTGCYNNSGSNHGMSKLKESQVIEIKKLMTNGEKNYIIANSFNVKQSTICDIRKGRTWSHL